MESHNISGSPLLRVTLLGAPAFAYAGKAFDVERVQNRALLYRLSVELAPVARSELAFLFWPDVSDARAQRLLTQLLSHVRRALPAELLVTNKTHVGLDETKVWSDAATFLALCRGEKHAPSAMLQQAVELYRGPLLEGQSLPGQPEYEAWLDGERSRFERMYLESLGLLIDRHIEQKQYEVAVELARQFLTVDELAEEIHRRLIDCYTALGDRAAAVQQYEACVRILERELSVPPLPETTAAYQRARVATKQKDPGGAFEPAWATLPGPNTPLVGRSSVLQGLESTYHQVQAQHGHVVLLSGEAGIGKSRLMQEFARRVEGEALIVAAACRPSVQSIPYQPLVEAMRPLLRRPDITSRISDTWLQQLSMLFPELAGRGADATAVPHLPDAPAAHSALFEALYQAISALTADSTPVLLCLDDLQWADTTTLDWLSYLAARIRQLPLLACATYRSDASESLSGLLWELGRLRAYTEYTLSALQACEVQQILEFLQVPEAAALASRLREVTGGNAFFLLETVQGLQETGQLTLETMGSRHLPVSQTVREAVKSRLARLQPVARQILEAAAVWGHTVTFDAVRQASGRSELETVEGLEELIGRHVLQDHGDSFHFNHDLTRSVVYQELSQWRKRVLHRRTAEVMERGLRNVEDSRRTGIVAEIGFHFAEAQEAGRAVNYLVEAGDYARNLYDHAAALNFYQQALTCLRMQGDHARIAQVLMKIGLTYHTNFNYAAARDAFEEGFDYYQHAITASLETRLPLASQPLRLVSPFPSPETWDPGQASDFHAFTLILQLFSGLVRADPNLDIVPEVAERWEMVDDGRKYIFSLSEQACWSDGVPVTAHDFCYSWLRMLDPQLGLGTYVSHLYAIRGARAYHEGQNADPASVGVEAVDAKTIAVTLEEPIGHFLHLLVHASFMPVPRHVVEGLGEKWTATAPFVSNGPFLLEHWRPDEISLRRNPTYHGLATGNVDRVIYYSAEDWPAKLRMYEQGEIDVLCLRHPPTNLMDRARRRFENEYVSFPTLHTDFLCFNTASEPFIDVRVRLAFAMALDKEVLADKVLRGYPAPAVGGYTPPGMPGHLSRPVLPYNPERARRLLAEAGYGGGRPFPAVEWLMVTPAYTETADYLRSQWQRVLGVDIAYRQVSWDTLLNRIYTSPPTIFVVAELADYPDPDAFFRERLIQVYSNYHDEVFDWLLQEARTTFDQAKRVALYEQLDRMVMEEAVFSPLAYGRVHALVKPKVKAFPFSPLQFWCWKDVVVGD
jgi:ABC-type oligopeptide transport system substrate-binding subunit/DNA-binding SARP family transcriptional activator